MIRTRKEKPPGPEDPVGLRERLAWLVIDVGTGSVLGKITRVRNTEPGYTDHWQAYAINEAAYGAPENPPVRLGPWDQCRDAQSEIEKWHVEQNKEVTS